MRDETASTLLICAGVVLAVLGHPGLAFACFLFWLICE